MVIFTLLQVIQLTLTQLTAGTQAGKNVTLIVAASTDGKLLNKACFNHILSNQMSTVCNMIYAVWQQHWLCPKKLWSTPNDLPVSLFLYKNNRASHDLTLRFNLINFILIQKVHDKSI